MDNGLVLWSTADICMLMQTARQDAKNCHCHQLERLQNLKTPDKKNWKDLIRDRIELKDINNN